MWLSANFTLCWRKAAVYLVPNEPCVVLEHCFMLYLMHLYILFHLFFSDFKCSIDYIHSKSLGVTYGRSDWIYFAPCPDKHRCPRARSMWVTSVNRTLCALSHNSWKLQCALLHSWPCFDLPDPTGYIHTLNVLLVCTYPARLPSLQVTDVFSKKFSFMS